MHKLRGAERSNPRQQPVWFSSAKLALPRIGLSMMQIGLQPRRREEERRGLKLSPAIRRARGAMRDGRRAMGDGRWEMARVRGCHHAVGLKLGKTISASWARPVRSICPCAVIFLRMCSWYFPLPCQQAFPFPGLAATTTPPTASRDPLADVGTCGKRELEGGAGPRCRPPQPRTRRPRPAMLGVLSPGRLRLRHPNSGGTKAPSRCG